MELEVSLTKNIVDKYTEEVFLEYQKRTRTSKEKFERAKNFLPGGNSRSGTYWEPYPTYFSRGKGFNVWDLDGNRYIDFINNMTSLIHGHAHPKIIEAVREVLEYGTAYNWPTEYAIRLAEMLCQRIPSFDKVRFTNSGTEATLNTLRLATAFTGKSKILKAEGAYHGTHLTVCVSVGLDPEQIGAPSSPNSVLEFGTPERVEKDVAIFPYNNQEATEKIFMKHRDELAAVIVEPLCCRIKHKDDFLRFLREITIGNDVLLIFDEVISARISRGGAQERYGVTPDLTAIGKIFGGGLPFGGFGGREDIMVLTDPSRDRYVSHAGTFNANPLTMAAGIAATEMLTSKVYDKLEQLGNAQRTGLRNVLEVLGIAVQITGDASLTRMHFSPEEIESVRTAQLAAKKRRILYQLLGLQMLNRGFSIPQRLLTALSTVMSKQEIGAYVNAFRESMEWMKPLIEKTAPELME